MEKLIKNQIMESSRIKQLIVEDETLIQQIGEIASLAIETYQRGKKILLAGNGGSAADAQHIAGELVSRFLFDRPGLPAMALTTDSSILTAIGNDYGYQHLFSRQIQANGEEGDLFIGLSTSGTSSNIIQALEECKKKGIRTVGLTGQTGGRMIEYCETCLRVPSTETPRIQEAHILIGHIICYMIEETIFGQGKRVSSWKPSY